MYSPLIQAKINLYRMLLEVPHGQETDSEVELLYIIANDPDIQNILHIAKKLTNSPNTQTNN